MKRPREFRFSCAVYPIVDTARRGPRSPLELVEALLAAGVPLLQLRDKKMALRELCDLAGAVQSRCVAAGALLVVNDRADVARLVGAAGVHLGQTDLPPSEARRILGEHALIGYSTHDLEQVRLADGLDCIDYIGFGPIFPTTSKANPDPCPGLEGLRAARLATRLPIAAIGGIDASTARAVRTAGADTIAMIGALAVARDVGALVRRLVAEAS